MVLMLVLLVMLGYGGVCFASHQTDILDAIVGTGSLPGFAALALSQNPETYPIAPLWSG